MSADYVQPSLDVHVEAAGGSHAALGWPAVYNKQVWRLVAFYMFAIIMFGFINSVLSVIFVIELITSEHGIQSPVPIPLGVDIPWEWDGKVVDPCSQSIGQPNCAYDLAITSYSSQLITYSEYTVGGYFGPLLCPMVGADISQGGVTFEPLNGT